MSRATDRRTGPRSPAKVALAVMALLVASAGFVALGVWQVQRLHWKHDLVARVEARVHARPASLPPRAAWPRLRVQDIEYLRVVVRGRYLRGRDTPVQALTALGAGHWVLTPLRTALGETVLVNRGFVPAGEVAAAAPAGEVRVGGLLRADEPRGRPLRRNDPASGRWYSRDVQAIAAARRLGPVAPFFIDAGFDPAAPAWPRGGMTVLAFRDHHLQYALTWFALALMTAAAAVGLIVHERRLRHHVRLPSPPGTAHGCAPIAGGSGS